MNDIILKDLEATKLSLKKKEKKIFIKFNIC